MSEFAYVEKPILTWLSGDPIADPNDKGLGWTYRDDKAMEKRCRPVEDPIVEAILIPALQRVNPGVVKTEAQAKMAIAALRSAMNLPDRLEANRRTLALLRDGASIVLVPGQPAATVQFIEFDPQKQERNDFTATNQYRVKGDKTCKADTVLLVNGIPLVVAEFKKYNTSGDWMEGHKQLHRYMRQAPLLLAANVFCVASDDQEFRYGAVLFHDATEDDIKQHRDRWGPWLSQYPVKRMYWNAPADEKDLDAVHAATIGLLRLKPCHVLDFLRHFVVFETKEGKVTKKTARYQQFEAANDIVDRVVALCGKPATSQDRTGLIWHTQGSGKSLTMIYAANKLRRHSKLDNPTVYVVVDRRDLKTQIGEDFENCDYDGVVKAFGVEDLKSKIAGDKRETIITTVQSFQRMDNLQPNLRDNTILLIDEAHRSQKGQGVGYAMTMRAKLPNSFRFGLTGTPIDRTMVNTHRDFGPVVDGQQERYLSYYGIRQAIRDGATLEVYYEYRKVPLQVDEEKLNVSFEQMADELELEEDEEIKDMVQRKETRWKAMARDPRRVAKVVENIVEHFLEHPDPSGFKAQIVTIDRQACVIYKDVLDEAFKNRGYPPEWSDVIISAAQNDTKDLEKYHYSKEEADERIAWFKLSPREWEKWNTDKYGDDAAHWRPPLKILIVCDRLLTGFDAPIEQVMYLDKPLRDHTLLQAMARTNRPMPAMNKRNGLIIDYFGVFEDLQKALNFDESIREEAAIDWEQLKRLVPEELKQCMRFFDDIKIEATRACLLACLRKLADLQVAAEFETQFKRLEVLWEAIAPDECLYPFRHEYNWLCSIYIAHRRRKRGPVVTYEELAAKTRKLIQQHTEFMDIAQDIPIYRIDDNYLTKVMQLPSPADRAAELEAALTRELQEQGDGFVYKKLGERLQRIVERKNSADAEAVKSLQELEKLVQEMNEAKSEPQKLGLTGPGEYGFYKVVKTFSKNQDQALCVKAAKMALAKLKANMPLGWADNTGGRQKVAISLQAICYLPELEPLDLAPIDDADPPFIKAAVDELAKVSD